VLRRTGRGGGDDTEEAGIGWGAGDNDMRSLDGGIDDTGRRGGGGGIIMLEGRVLGHTSFSAEESLMSRTDLSG
jgi:hypothetical protein